MIGKNSKGIVLLAMVGVLLAASGCSSGVRVGKLQTGSETVELGDATTARVEIDMGAEVVLEKVIGIVTLSRC